MPMKEISTVLQRIAAEHCYDGFVHYVQLGAWSKESGIPLGEWSRLLETWPYDPVASMAEHGRGNCADFAATAVQRLGEIGVTSRIVGVLPDSSFTPGQRAFLSYQHVAVIGDHAEGPFMCEPGWNLPAPISIAPQATTVLGEQRFRTVMVNEQSLHQERRRQHDAPDERLVDLRPLSPEAVAAVTKQAMRLPNRRMSLSARLDHEPERHCIRFDSTSELLKAPLRYVPRRFHPKHITSRVNRKLSRVFGFDVKEELLACYAVKKALPKDFWIT